MRIYAEVKKGRFQMTVLSQCQAEDVGFAFGKVSVTQITKRIDLFVSGAKPVRKDIKVTKYFVPVRFPDGSSYIELEAVLTVVRGGENLVLKGLSYSGSVVDVILDFDIQSQPP